MPVAILDVAEINLIGEPGLIHWRTGLEEVRMIVGNVAEGDVLVGVECDGYAITDAGSAKETATATGSIGTERVIVKHECDTIGTRILVAQIDIEADHKVRAQIDALI